MLDFNPVTGESGKCIAVGRGAIAIRLALEEIDKKGKYILVPSNICYAAVLPIIYAGYKPVFCDVDSRSGNVTRETITKTCFENVVAAIIPHMYGNPIPEMKEIVEFLHFRNVVVIEDCASLMSRDGGAYIPGTLGDFVIYSTGYSKTIDIGLGGLLYSKSCDLRRSERLEQSFCPWNDEYKTEWNEFSRIYRILRNDGQMTNLASVIYLNLPETLYKSYNFSISLEEKRRIVSSLNDLDRIIASRRRKYQTYNDLLACFINVSYPYEESAVPWRFNLLIENKHEFIEQCLHDNLPISDWYPRVTTVFQNSDHFVGAEWHEEHIVNFPLLKEDCEIKRICEVMKKYKVISA